MPQKHREKRDRLTKGTSVENVGGEREGQEQGWPVGVGPSDGFYLRNEDNPGPASLEYPLTLPRLPHQKWRQADHW